VERVTSPLVSWVLPLGLLLPLLLGAVVGALAGAIFARIERGWVRVVCALGTAMVGSALFSTGLTLTVVQWIMRTDASLPPSGDMGTVWVAVFSGLILSPVVAAGAALASLSVARRRRQARPQ
jgi:predicted permease